MGGLKTITVSDADARVLYVLCLGHVDAETFTSARAAEGWDLEPVSDDDLVHEYWKKIGDLWVCSNREEPDAQAVTVLDVE